MCYKMWLERDRAIVGLSVGTSLFGPPGMETGIPGAQAPLQEGFTPCERELLSGNIT